MYRKLYSAVLIGTTMAALVMFSPRSYAAPTDIVDLEANTQQDPPASAPGKSTGLPTREDDQAKQQAKDDAAREKLNLRAGERVGGDPVGKAQVLGMALQEMGQERVKVVDVAMSSPAFDAGVMKGDELLAFQGFKGETYKKWIDGLRRLTADTAPGLKIPVVVKRNGKQLTMLLEIREKVVRPSKYTVAQPESPIIPQGLGPALPATEGAVPVNAGNNVFVDNGGAFGAFFGGASASPKERAFANIVRIGNQPAPAPKAASGSPAPAPNTGVAPNADAGGAPHPDTGVTPNAGGARVGMAGFRDEASGMVVMVDVATLAPGTYTVSVGDPSLIGGATVPGPAPHPQAPDRRTLQPVPPPAPAGRLGAPQGSLPPASMKMIPKTVLAQVATDGIDPVQTPATGKVIPSGSTATGQSKANNAQAAQDAARLAQEKNPNTGASTTIGTLTVDQSGTGRLQQKVEALQVRSIVGQAIVLYPQGPTATGAGAVPPNVKSTADTRGAAPSALGGERTPVAGGIIQLVMDRQPAEPTQPNAAQDPAGATPVAEQPGKASPPVDPNLVR